jgi:hypothetical protein
MERRYDHRIRMIFILLSLRIDLNLLICCGNFVFEKIPLQFSAEEIKMSDFPDPLASSEQDPQGFGSTPSPFGDGNLMTDVGMDSDESIEVSSNGRAVQEETAEAPPPKTSACCDFDKVLASLDYSLFLPNSTVTECLPAAAITIHEVIEFLKI